LCDIGNRADAWIHAGGAFGLWMETSKNKCYLVRDFKKPIYGLRMPTKPLTFHMIVALSCVKTDLRL
jgi:hypothetical protein